MHDGRLAATSGDLRKNSHIKVCSMSHFKKLFGGGDNEQRKPDGELRAVPGAGVYSLDGKVGYNMLDPFMQKFMGRCIGAVKKSGVSAGGTGQFSISINDGAQELILDEFWSRVCEKSDTESTVIEDVVEAAKRLAES